MTTVEREVERICHSGVLGRSLVYERLLRYLSETTLAGSLPKEVDIAVDVFDRKEFDSSADSSIRVYMHNLRQKLQAYYEGPGADRENCIRIPKGEYRLLVEAPPRGGKAAVSRHWLLPSTSTRLTVAALMAGCLVAGWLASVWLTPAGPYQRSGETALWQSFAGGDGPIVVVLGDYYIFGEVERDGTINRLIRDFRVNSRDDLEARDEPGDALYADVRLSYLPVGIGSALADVLGVIRSRGREVIVTAASALDVKTVQTSDIVYIGYISGLGLLEDFVFATSNFKPGATFDELVTRSGEHVYVSGAGFPYGSAADYVDYGFLSTFSGPNGNRVLAVTGMRDEGLMQMAALVSSEEAVSSLLGQIPESGAPPAMEALYRVRGMHRLNIASRLVYVSTLSEDDIWIDTPRRVRSASTSSDASGKPAK